MARCERDGPRSDLDDLVDELLAENPGRAPEMSGEEVAAHVDRVTAYLVENSLFGLAPDEIDALVVQQRQWEATAYAAASDIIAEAHRTADAIRASYRGRHQADDVAAEPRSPATPPRHRFPEVQRHGTLTAVVYTGSLDDPVLDLADMIAQIRPELWPVVVGWMQHDWPGDTCTTYRLADRTFTWAQHNVGTMPDPQSRTELNAWIRRGAVQVLHEQSRAYGEDGWDLAS